MAIKDAILEVKNDILGYSRIIFQLEVDDDHKICIEELQGKVKEIYFVEGNPLIVEHLDVSAKFVGFISICNAIDWKKECATNTSDVGYYEYRLGLMPSVVMEELDKIASRFNKCERGN